MLTALLNPWVILAALGALAGAFGAGYSANDGAERVQTAWDRANVVAVGARQARIDAARAAQDRLQSAAENDRRERDAKNKQRDLQLADALGRLRDRPERPGPGDGAGVPGPAGPAAERGVCTGAGLYRDDAAFLTRLADTAQRIREQRDDFRAKYERAQGEIARINAGRATP